MQKRLSHIIGNKPDFGYRTDPLAHKSFRTNRERRRHKKKLEKIEKLHQSFRLPGRSLVRNTPRKKFYRMVRDNIAGMGTMKI